MLNTTPLNPKLESIFLTKMTDDLDGNPHAVDDMISKDEASFLYSILKKIRPMNTLEVGLAHGVSALVFCQAHAENAIDSARHYAVDPNQFTTYGGAALKASRDSGLDNYLTILEGPSHLMVPKLIEEEVKIDFALIDGWHTFDYTLVDFFLVDKLVKPGGYIAFHDVYGRAKQKVIDFIFTHRRYEIAPEMGEMQKEPKVKALKFFFWRLFKDPALLFSWYHWRFQFRNSSGLLVLRKVEDFEPDFDFYKSF